MRTAASDKGRKASQFQGSSERRHWCIRWHSNACGMSVFFFPPPWQSTTTTPCAAAKQRHLYEAEWTKGRGAGRRRQPAEQRCEGKDFHGALWWFGLLSAAFFALVLIFLRFLLHPTALPALLDETPFPQCLKCPSPPPPAAAPQDLSLLTKRFFLSRVYNLTQISPLIHKVTKRTNIWPFIALKKKAQGWFCQDVCCQINSSLASKASGSAQNLVAKANKHSHKSNTNIKLGNYASQMWSI